MTDAPVKSTILVVEDEKPLRDIYSIVLKKTGYTVISAANGREGVEQVESNKPDVVLLDIFMPVMNGIEFMKTVDLSKHPDMKVVVFSNNSDSGVKDQARSLGAYDVVLKSELTPTDLVNLVHDKLGASESSL